MHNWKYTDNKILEVIEKENLSKIQISQGYSNCSIAVIDDNSVIVSDNKTAEILKKYNIDVLCLNYIPNIKLFNAKNEYSKMNGFIGGAISRIQDNIIVFGDLEKIDIKGEIRKFIESKKFNIIEFKNQDVIDYGGVIEI